MNNNILNSFVIGPAALNFFEDCRNSNFTEEFKFVVVKDQEASVLLIMKAEQPFKYHNSAVQYYMGLRQCKNIPVRGGGQFRVNNDKKVVEIFEGSQAFGWPCPEEAIEHFQKIWPEYEVMFTNDQERLAVEEKMTSFDADAYSKIKHSDVPDACTFCAEDTLVEN